jgi:predicted nucleic-acid-binding protein
MAAKSSEDLADLLIGLTAYDNGCTATLTFDKKAARSSLFTLIK